MDETAAQAGTGKGRAGVLRRVLASMVLGAALCYSIAFVQYSSGAAHYSAYVEAYMACANDPLFGVHAADLCKTTPTVRDHLDSQTMAYAMMVPTLSVALSLTIAAMCLPLTSRGRSWRQQQDHPAKPTQGAS